MYKLYLKSLIIFLSFAYFFWFLYFKLSSDKLNWIKLLIFIRIFLTRLRELLKLFTYFTKLTTYFLYVYNNKDEEPFCLQAAKHNKSYEKTLWTFLYCTGYSYKFWYVQICANCKKDNYQSQFFIFIKGK